MDTPYSALAAGFLFLTQVVIYMQQRSNSGQIKELHLSLNSRLDKLLSSTSAVARMEGHAAGIKEERDNPSKLK